jgi:hypothetical protein
MATVRARGNSRAPNLRIRDAVRGEPSDLTSEFAASLDAAFAHLPRRSLSRIVGAEFSGSDRAQPRRRSVARRMATRRDVRAGWPIDRTMSCWLGTLVGQTARKAGRERESRRACPRPAIPDRGSAGSHMTGRMNAGLEAARAPNAYKAGPGNGSKLRSSPSATDPPGARNVGRRPVDSELLAAQGSFRMKRSVTANAPAPGCGVAPIGRSVATAAIQPLVPFG